MACLQNTRKNSIVWPRDIADDPASLAFEAIETIIWKLPIAPVVRIVSKYFETTRAIGTIRAIIWKPGLKVFALGPTTGTGNEKQRTLRKSKKSILCIIFVYNYYVDLADCSQCFVYKMYTSHWIQKNCGAKNIYFLRLLYFLYAFLFQVNVGNTGTIQIYTNCIDCKTPWGDTNGFYCKYNPTQRWAANPT